MPTQRNRNNSGADKGRTPAARPSARQKKPTSRTAPKPQASGRLRTPKQAQPKAEATSKPAATARTKRIPTARPAQRTAAGGTAQGRAMPATGSQRKAGSQSAPARPASTRSRTVNAGLKQAQPTRGTAQRRTAVAQQGPAGPLARAADANLGRKALTVLVAVAALFFCLGVLDLVTSFGKVHHGVSVQGVDVGGLSKVQASEKIVQELSPVVEQVKVTMYENADKAAADGVDLGAGIPTAAAAKKSGSDVDGDGVNDKWSIEYSTLGAYIDGDALADRAYAVGRGLDFLPQRLGSWLGGTRLSADVFYSAEKYGTFAAEVNKTIGKKISNSKAKIEDGVATLKKGHDGYQLNQEDFSRALSRAVFGDSHSFAAPMEVQPRHITPDTASRVVDQINQAISADVVVKYKEDSWVLQSDDLGDIVSQKVLEPTESLAISKGSVEVVPTAELGEVEPYDTSAGTDPQSGWVLQPYVNQKKLDKFLVKMLGDKAQGGAKDAKFYVKKDKIKIKKSKEGTGPDRQQVELEMQQTLFGSRSSVRTLELADTTIQPNFTTEDAKAMGIKDRLARWEIPLSGSENRIHNIRLLCKLIDGSITAPGASWSFNATTGERTDEKGFKTAPVIVGPKHEDQLGGGVCQVATCVFNCACYSGLGINNRVNHDFYIPAYDDRGFADATVSWDVPDLEWVNDTANYILLTADADGDDVIVQFWGTDEGRQITCDRGKWKKGTKAKTVRENTDELPAGETRYVQSPVDGRSIQIHYVAKDKDGKVLHDILFNSEYSAQDEIIEVGTAGASSTEDSSGSGDTDTGDGSDDGDADGDAEPDDDGSDDGEGSGDEDSTSDDVDSGDSDDIDA